MNDITVRRALKIINEHRKLDNFRLTSMSIWQEPIATELLGTSILRSYRPPAELKLSATITVDHPDWNEVLDVDYLVLDRDLTDDGEVNKVIGDISKFDSDTKEALRLAYILLDGYRYATEHIQHKDFHPRVIRVQMRF